MVWTFGAPLRRQELPAPVAWEVSALFSQSFRCYFVAACLRPARSARSVFGPGNVPALPGRPMPMIGLHGALPRDAVCFVPTRAVRLQFAPQVEGTPAFLGDAPDEFVHEDQFGLSQSERKFGFHREQRWKFLPNELRG